MSELSDLDAVGQALAVRRGDVSPAELVDDAIARIEKLNPELNAVIHPLFEKARAAAGGDLPDGPFRGVPAVMKDLDGHLAGDPFHAGMRALKEAGYVAPFDSYMHARLRDAGFIFVGKTNCPELGLLPSTEPLAYGPTHNPWDTTRSPGGSSGGTAAAVASRMVALGTAGDGGGSIRCPASACGIFGLKPTRGRVSLGPDGGDTWGGFVVRSVLTRSVRDTAAILDVIAGPAPGDPHYPAAPERPYGQEVGVDPGKLRIGLMTAVPAGMNTLAPECAAAVNDAAELLGSLGHEVEESFPEQLLDSSLVEHFVNIVNAWTAHSLDHWGRELGRELTAEDVEPGTWFQAESGRQVNASTYINALESLTAQNRSIGSWWGQGFDLLLTPSLPEPPWTLGQFHDDPMMGLFRAGSVVPFLAPLNASGQPAASIPLCWSDDDLPIGVQLVAQFGREDILIRIASQLEEARPWADRRPPIS
ncbi:MAG: amidase [Actinomycetota bacterium]|nr:amidase [Actinomycetota bacterium]